jgi:hypothetical protein
VEQLPEKLLKLELAPHVRHINRIRRGMQWLGPAIERPKYLVEGVPLIGPKIDPPEIVA